MTLAEKVRTVRKQLGLTQSEFAKALNVSFATVNRWENGRTIPSSLAQKAIDEFCESNFISFGRLD